MDFRPTILCLFFVQITLGFDLDLSLDDDIRGLEAVGRTFFPLALGGLGSGMNASILAAVAAALASALLSLLSLVGLGLLVASNMDKEKKVIVTHGGYGHGGGGSHGNSHSSYRKQGSYYSRMLDTLHLDWESLTLVDWMSILHETWTDFDPSNLECQKRFICDVHQNKEEFGAVADSLVYYFSYLKYGAVLSLPEYLKSILDEFVDAADKGNTMTRDCGDIFSYCSFSVKELIHKYSPKYSHDDDANDTDTSSPSSDTDNHTDTSGQSSVDAKDKDSYEKIVNGESDDWKSNYSDNINSNRNADNNNSNDNKNNNNNNSNDSTDNSVQTVSHILTHDNKNYDPDSNNLKKNNHFYYNYNYI